MTNAEALCNKSLPASTETRRLVRTDSPGRPPRLSHSSWTCRYGPHCLDIEAMWTLIPGLCHSSPVHKESCRRNEALCRKKEDSMRPHWLSGRAASVLRCHVIGSAVLSSCVCMTDIYSSKESCFQWIMIALSFNYIWVWRLKTAIKKFYIGITKLAKKFGSAGRHWLRHWKSFLRSFHWDH